MKKITFLGLLFLSNLSFATNIQITGIEKLDKATEFDFAHKFYSGNCSGGSIVECHEDIFAAQEMPMHIFNTWFASLNNTIQNTELKKSISGNDSFLTLKFQNYPGVCRIILSNQSNVRVTMNSDGSCQSF